MLSLAIDLETHSEKGTPDIMDDEVILVSAVFSDGREYLWDSLKKAPDWFSQILLDNDVLKLSHNAPFELSLIARDMGGIEPWPYWDTLAIERLLTQGLNEPCDLASTAWRRATWQLNKEVRESFKFGRRAIGDAEREYCLEDSRVLHPIHDKQVELVKDQGQHTAARIENCMSSIVSEMELSGIGFDNDLWESFKPIIAEKRNEALRTVWDMLGCDYQVSLFGDLSGGISLTSWQQTLPALRRVGIDLGSYGAGAIREHIYANVENEFTVTLLQAVLDFKKWDKALSWNYVNHVRDDGRIHSSFNPQGARTFRMTSSDPNMQNVSKPLSEDVNFRHAFRARPGYTFVGADYSQIELRVLAHLTQEKWYVDAFNEGKDLHTLAAEIVLKRALIDAIERNLGKVVNFGVVAFGGGAQTLQAEALKYGMVVPRWQARAYVEEFRNKNKRIEQWSKEQHQFMMLHGYLQTPLGHRRWFVNEDRITVARNTPVQSMAGGILKDGMDRMFLGFRQQGIPARIVLQVHDEVLVETPLEARYETRAVVEESLVAAGEEWITSVPVTVDSYISKTWEK